MGVAEKGGGAGALQFTAEFLLLEKKIDALLPDYEAVVNDRHVNAALDGC